MPLYEYKCESCGETFEKMQKFSDQPLTLHDGCGGRVQRLLSAPALQFKGTGWYITDYARSNGSNGKGEKTDASGDAKNGSAKAAKSETPVASGAESKSGSDSKSDFKQPAS